MAKGRAAAQFFIAFFMGIFILAIPFGYALFRFAAAGNDAEQPQEEFAPLPSDTLTLTTALKESGGQPPCCFILCRISPYENEVSFAVLPPETLVEDAGSFYHACEVWGKEGAKRGAQALSSAAGITKGRYLELDSDAIIKLGEVIGAVDIALKEEVLLEQGMLALPAQRQLIDGIRAALLINHRGYSGGESQRLEMTAELLSQTLSQRAPLLNDALLVRLFEAAVNYGESDMTVGDFEARRRALVYMMTNDFDVEQIEIEGSYNGEDNAFLLSGESISALTREFSTREAQT